MNACISFEESLKTFIKDPKSGGAAHLAAQCLFEVRKLENVIAEEGNNAALALGTGLFDLENRRNDFDDKAPSAAAKPSGSNPDATANESVLITLIPPINKEDL